MYLRWTQHLKTEEEKQRFRNEVVGAKRVLDRLRDILIEDEEALVNKEISVKAFEEPNWDYQQAFHNGTRANSRAIQKLINLDQQEIK